MADVTIQQLMDLLPEFFVPDRAQGIDRVIQFALSGEGGGSWVVTIQNQTVTVRNGSIPVADLTLVGSAQDVLKIFAGELDPLKAYLRGRMKLLGNKGLAMQLSRLFDVDLNRLRSMGAGL